MDKRLSTLLSMAVLLVMVTSCSASSTIKINTPDLQNNGGTPTPGGEITVPGVTINLYTPGPNPLIDTADSHGRPANVLLGIWHGLISPVTLVASFINPKFQVYEVHNDGNQYNLGFLIGIAVLFVLLGFGVGSRRR